ncbi:alpha/beta hydrolase [Holzapfeliella sp. He02]|uniref:Alpha/beta hydrolase n=1 Tax=Holzapfeliella saturejae TaxID=3082953 RepID=A0ABU8SHV6_9LACO
MASNQIYSQEFGQGIPIYFVHGNGLNSTSMIEFYESKKIEYGCHRRVYIDIPGMGDSSLKSTIKNSDDVLNELIKYVEKDSKGSPFKLCGYSYGAYLCQGIAWKLPQQVQSVFFTGPVVKAESNKRQTENHYNQILERVVPFENIDYFEDYLSMNVVINSVTWKNYQKMIVPALEKGISNFWLTLKDADYTLSFENDLLNKQSYLKGYLLVGEYDNIVGIKDQYKLANNKLLDYQVIHNSGHNLLIDQPNKVIQYFQKFIENRI